MGSRFILKIHSAIKRKRSKDLYRSFERLLYLNSLAIYAKTAAGAIA